MLAVSTSKTSWKRSYECETSVTIVRMSCENVAINKKTQSSYIYSIYILNWIIEYIHIYSYTIIYTYTVNVNLMLICIELSNLIIYCKYA